MEGIRRLRDFLRIGLAGLEKFWDSLGFHEVWISSIKIFCGGNSHSLRFPEDWISRHRDNLWRGFACLGIS